MATLVLGAAGNALFPGVGGFIGAAVGGLIDNFLLFPALFPKPALQGPRLDDLQVQLASEGSPIKWVIGPKTRPGGVVIWMTDLQEHASETSVGKGGGGQSATNYTYTIDVAVAVTDVSVIEAIKRIERVWGNVKEVYNGSPAGRYESITFYDGSQTTPDPTIQAAEGVDTPAFIDTAYFVITGYELADFGNMLPSHTMHVRQSNGGLSVAGAVALHLQRVGYDPDEYDVSRVPGCFKGQVISGPTSGSDALAPLLMTYALGIQESDRLTFFARGEEVEFEAGADDLAAHQEGEDSPRVIKLGEPSDNTVMREATARFVNEAEDLLAGGAAFRRQRHNSDHVAQVDLQLTLAPDEAEAACKRLVWASATERRRVELSLPPSFIALQEGDVVVATDSEGDTHRVYVGEVTHGANDVIQVIGVISDASVYSQTGIARTQSGGTPPYVPSDLVPVVLCAPALIDGLCDTSGVYFAACLEDGTAQWRGAQLFRDGVGRGVVSSQAVTGVVLEPLADCDASAIDTHSSMLLQLDGAGVLENSTIGEMLAGDNTALVEHPSGECEVVSFRDAEELEDGTWRVEYFLRGLRGTESLCDGHVAGARFVLAVTNQVQFDRSDHGSGHEYQLVPVGGLASESPMRAVTNVSSTMRPFAPTHLRGTFDPSTDDLLVEWERRGKRVVQSLAPCALSPDEQPERYVLEFRAGGPAAPVLREVEVTAATSYTYSSADRTADGTSSVVSVTISQVSTAVGRGRTVYRRFR